MTSDEFFKNNKLFFDLIFLDGLHILHEQTMKDIDNSLNYLKKNGLIVIHDLCYQIKNFMESNCSKNVFSIFFGTGTYGKRFFMQEFFLKMQIHIKL